MTQYKSSMEYGIYHLEVLQSNDVLIWGVIIGTIIIATWIMLRLKKDKR